MRRTLQIVLGLVLLAAAPATARSLFAAPPALSAQDYPGAPKPVYDDHARAPYAMTYTEEAAQSLGFHDGRADVFSTQAPSHSYWPSLSGGLGGSGAMLKLQWHPGQ